MDRVSLVLRLDLAQFADLSFRLAGIVMPCVRRLLLRACCGRLSQRREPEDGTAGALFVKENLQRLKVHENRFTEFQPLEKGPANHAERDQSFSGWLQCRDQTRTRIDSGDLATGFSGDGWCGKYKGEADLP